MGAHRSHVILFGSAFAVSHCGSGFDVSVPADAQIDGAAIAVEAGYPDGPLACDAGGPCVPSPTVLADHQSPSLITVDPSNVYWTNTGTTRQILSCATGGCGDAPSVLWSTSYFSIPGLAVEGGNVYFPALPGGYIATCALTGCNGAPTNLATNVEAIAAFVADGTNAYWNGGGPIQACALGGCSSATTLFSSPLYASSWVGIAVDASNVYWSDGWSHVYSCPKSGCVGPPTVLAQGLSLPGPIAVDGERVYWIEMGTTPGLKNVGQTYSNGSVKACAHNGSDHGTTVLATYPTWLGGGAMAADASGVYWSTEDASTTFGEIVGCASSGCGGTPKIYGVTSTKRPTLGVAVDAAHVYWTDEGLGEVLTTPK